MLAIATGLLHDGGVKFVLAFALVLHLSGLPAVTVSPCASASAAAGDCCMRHRTEAGGPVIGLCGCEAATAQKASEAVSVGPGSTDRAEPSPAAPIGFPAIPQPTIHAPALFAFADASPGASPPRLSGTGFRC